MSDNLVINNLFQALEDKEASNINGGHHSRRSYHRKRKHYKYHYYHGCYGRKKYWKKYWGYDYD